MRSLSRRVVMLERGMSGDVAPAVKVWLGWPLSDAERARLDDPRPEIEPTDLSEEIKEWLGID